MDIRKFFSPPTGGKSSKDSSKKDTEKQSDDKSKSKESKSDSKKKTPLKEKKQTPAKEKNNQAAQKKTPAKEKKETPAKEKKQSEKTKKETQKKDKTESVKTKTPLRESTQKYVDDDVDIIDDSQNHKSEGNNNSKHSKKDKTKEKNDSSKNKDDNKSSSNKKSDSVATPSKLKETSKHEEKAKSKHAKLFESSDEDEDFQPKKRSKSDKKGSKVIQSDSEEEEPVPKKQRKKKKTYMSDSEEEPVLSPVKTALDAFVHRSKDKPAAAPKLLKAETKKAVSVADFFGTGSVQRKEKAPTKRKADKVTPKPIKSSPKRKALDEDNLDDFEIHDDDDFEETLRQLDEQQPAKKVKVETEDGVKAEKSFASKLASKMKGTYVEDTPEKPSKGKELLNKKTPPKKSSPKSSPEKHKEVKKSPIKMEISPAKPSKASPAKPASSSPAKPTTTSPKKEETSSPGKTPLQKKGANYRSFLNREGPQNLGGKEVPDAAENCLEGLTFVISGVLESFERDEMKTIIEKYGGKVTGNVSKKTSYLVLGRDPGQSKVAKAEQMKTKQLDEDGVLELLRSKPAKKSKYEIAAEKEAKESAMKSKLSKAQSSTPSRQSMQDRFGFNQSKDSLQKSPAPNSQSSQSSQLTASPQVQTNQSGESLMWVDKYKPTSLKQIIGQQGDKSNARKLYNWLNNWHKNIASGRKPAFNRFNDDGGGNRAALLSGPPGVGKTTTAGLVCKELGWSYVELNASDTRSKRSLKEVVAESLNNHTLVDFMGKDSCDKSAGGLKHCLIMDEVDGMAGNEDRGGMQELIGLIKNTKIPIICMCNDRQHQKVRSLANYCFDLRFQRPRVDQIKAAMMSIAFKEGLKIPPPALNEVIAAANQDVRQVMHNLSMWSAREKTLTYEQLKEDSSKAQKDLKMGPFDVARKVFVGGEETSKMNIHDKSNLFFHDYSFGPLFVQENYITVTPFAAKGDKKKHLKCLSAAADSIADGDLVDRKVRSGQNWSLLPMQAIFASVIPGDTMRGGIGGMIQFPQWLGKNSTTNKNARILQDLRTHMRLHINSDKNGLNSDYLPVMRKMVTNPLIDLGQEGVPDVISVLDNYDLLREDFDSILEVSQWPNKPDPMSKIDSKVKAAFTRAYNKEVHMTPYATGTATKKKRGGGGGEALEGMDGEGEGAVEEEEEENDDLTKDSMIKQSKKKSTAAKKSTAKATTSKGKGGGKGGGKGKGKK